VQTASHEDTGRKTASLPRIYNLLDIESQMLRNKNLVPPGGFSFIEERTGLEFNEKSWDALISKIISHRTYKQIGHTDLDAVEAEVESYYEKTLPSRYLRD